MRISTLRNNIAKIGLNLDKRFGNCSNQKHINEKTIIENKKCKGCVAQRIEHLSHSREDAGSNFTRKSRRAHTDLLSNNKTEKEEKQAHSLNKAPVSLTGISHESFLASENRQNTYTIRCIEQNNYLNVSVLINRNRAKEEKGFRGFLALFSPSEIPTFAQSGYATDSISNVLTESSISMYRYINFSKNNINKKSLKNHQKIFSLNLLSILIILLSLFLLLSAIALAIPNTLTLQGKLTNPSGASQQGTFNFSFRIYNNNTFGYYNITQNVTLTNGSTALINVTYINYTNILWEQNQSITTDANGVYDVILQNINLSFADQYYLGITIGTDNESVPRVNLTSSPYSFRANTSEALNPNGSYVVTNLSITGNATIGSGDTLLAISTQSFNLTTIGNIFSSGNLTIAGNTLFVDSLNSMLGIGINNPSYLLQVASGTNGRSVNLSNVLYINGSSGRVGIGTASPSEALTVIGNVNISGYLNISGNLNVNNNFNVSSSGDVRIAGGLNVSGVTNISNNFYATGNAVIGTSTSNTLEVNALINSNLVPSPNSRNLGSPTNFWYLAYIDKLTVNNLTAGASNISGTQFPSFTINANYTGNDAQDITLIFERGTPVTNAVLEWDSTNKRFHFNFPLMVDANMNLTVDTNTLFVDGSIKRVGIGTTTPNDILEVVGNVRVSGSLNASSINVTNALIVNNTLFVNGSKVGIGTNNPTLKLEVRDDSLDSVGVGNSTDIYGFLTFGTVVNGVVVRGNTNKTLTLGANKGTHLFIDTNGNVGINTTSPAQTLTVQGTLNVTPPGANISLFVASNGNVGIGNTTPTNLLYAERDQNANTFIIVKNAYNTTSARSGFYATIAGGTGTSLTTVPANYTVVTGWANRGIIATDSLFGGLTLSATGGSADLRFETGGSGSTNERVRIDSSGNVGINTTSPAQTFQVAGTANITSGSTQFLVNSNGDVTINLKG